MLTAINNSNRYLLLLKRIGFVLLFYLVFRIAFLVFNYGYFSDSGVGEILKAFIIGVRFDLSAIAYANALVILLHLLPFNFFNNTTYQKILKFIFLLSNIPAILLNIVDVAFFAFQGKRSTVDLFSIITTGSDIKNTIWQMMIDFWYVPLFFITLTIILIRFYPTRASKRRHDFPVFVRYLILLIGITVTIVLFRGGVQLKPVRIVAAAQYTNPKLSPLVLNSTFTILKTVGKRSVTSVTYMDDDELPVYFSKIKSYKKHSSTPYNVIILILESFSSEYIGYLNNGEGYTPVLDSLAEHALIFTNSIANAKRSIDGLPAITSSLPALMPESFITSKYTGNQLSGIAGYLNESGYSTAFFHGGHNGTMGFDTFTSKTGFNFYYGLNECSTCRNDGQWGIYDEDFYDFLIDVTDNTNQPFMHCFFSLSSHHPYLIPDEHKGVFPSGKLPIHESIGYADYSLGKFFEKARTKDWYKNTLFVITADHTGPSFNKSYMNPVGQFRIPLLFFMPTVVEPSINNTISQQCDIMPSILNFLHYNKPFVAFGESVFNDSSNKFSVNFTGSLYQCMNDSILLQFDGENVVSVYNFKTDPGLTVNLWQSGSNAYDQLEMSLKSYLQQYRTAIIENKLIPHP
jgi:phosphoglycerol transferase MdoB-like AlkP superfamily enzyme